MRNLFLFWLLVFTFCVFSQSRNRIDKINSCDYTYISNNLRECEQKFRKNIDDSRKINYQEGLANSYKKLSTVHALLGDYKAAIEDNLIALKIFEKNKNYKEIAIANADIAYRLRYLDYNQALTYFRKAINIGEKYKLEPELTSIYNNYGETIKDKYRDSALIYFEKSLFLAKKHKIHISRVC